MAKIYRDVRNPERYLGYGGQSYGAAPVRRRKASKPSEPRINPRPPGTTTVLRKAVTRG